MSRTGVRRSMIVLFFMATVAAMWCQSSPQPSSDEGQGWPKWRGPNGDGISTETGWNPAALAGGPKVVWTANVGGGVSGLVFRNGRLFTMSKNWSKETVLCLDAETGDEIWRYSYDTAGATGMDAQPTPTVGGNFVYTLGTRGDVCCLSVEDGTVLWQKNIVKDYKALKESNDFGTSPIIQGDLLILNVNSSGMALDKRTGALVWTSAIGSPLSDGKHATPVLYESNGTPSALLLSNQALVSVEPATGRVLWSYALPGTSCRIVDPVLWGSNVLIQLDGGRLIDISRQPVPECLRERRHVDQGSRQHADVRRR